MTIASYEPVILRVANRTALDNDAAKRTVAVVVESIERGDLADQDDLVHRVADALDLELSFAFEHTQVVCEAITELCEPSATAVLKEAAPKDVRELFIASPDRPEYHAPHTVTPEEPHTLAAGRGGSSTPLFEADADRAQHESVATSDNPHASDKISSSAGKQEGRTLASGAPGSSRPLSQPRD